jgi:hypothetical protein
MRARKRRSAGTHATHWVLVAPLSVNDAFVCVCVVFLYPKMRVFLEISVRNLMFIRKAEYV